MKYKSRIDSYNYIILALIIAVLALPNFVFNFSWWYLGVMIVLDALALLFTFSTCYELGENELNVKCLFINIAISYERIKEIKKVKVLSTNIATSIKCVQIGYGQRENGTYKIIFVSPLNEEDFLNNLKNKSVNVKEIKDQRN